MARIPLGLRAWRRGGRSLPVAAYGVVCVNLLGVVLAGAAQASPQQSPSNSYGEAVYIQAKGDELGALTRALLAKSNHATWPQTEEAELWRFDTLMRWGLHADAAEVLTKLEELGAQVVGPVAARDAAWFQLAEARYRKGLWIQAEEALGKIRKALPPEQETERRVIQAQCLMQRGEFRAAVKVWKDLADAKPYPVWARYNQAQAQIKSGDKIAGLSTLESVGVIDAETDEQRQIKDKANVTMGLGALEGKFWVEARRYLERVPLQGTESNRALLAYGWVSLAQQGPQSALAPWLALLPRESHDPSVLEAQVAVPYAYSLLGAKGKALQQYKQAIALFEREQVLLDGASHAVRQGVLKQSLLRLSGTPSVHDWPLAAIPDGLGLPHLLHVWSSDAVQDAFQGVRDMQLLRLSIQNRQARLNDMKVELVAQREAWAQLQKPMGDRDFAKQMGEMRQRLEALEAEVARYKGLVPPADVATDEQRAAQERVNALQAALQKRANVPELKALRDRLRLVQGVLTWQLYQAQQVQLGQLQQTLSAGRAGLSEAQASRADITQAVSLGRQRIEVLSRDVDVLSVAMTRLLPQVELLQGEYADAIGDLTMDEIQRQRNRLQAYLTQARFAMAKLYDKASNSGAQTPSKEPGYAR